MLIAHLIMTHKCPEQLIRLIKQLNHPNAHFYIHVDQKSDIKTYTDIIFGENIFFIKNRININWGGFSITLSILNSLKEILKANNDYNFINLISGQDYPLAHPQQINDYLEQHRDTNFISWDENGIWWEGAVNRYRKYHFTDYHFKGKYLIERFANILMPRRKFPLNIKLYGGEKSTWWTINSACAQYVCDVVLNDKKLIKFLKLCWGTDEFVIPSIIMSSPFKNNTVNNNLRYIYFPENSPRPKNLGIQDFQELISSKFLFARKFDITFDSAILDKIDQHLQNQEL